MTGGAPLSPRGGGENGAERRTGAAGNGSGAGPGRAGRWQRSPSPSARPHYDSGGAAWRPAHRRQDGAGGRRAGGGAEQSLEPAEPHPGCLRGGQAAQRRPRQRGLVPSGCRRGRRRRRRLADPLHLDPSFLLRERHQHPAGQQPGSLGPVVAARRRA